MNVFRARCIAPLLLALIGPPAFAAEPLDDIEKSAGEWVKLRVETTRLETDWRGEKSLLESMVAALTERAAGIEEKRDLVKAKTAQDRNDLAAMEAKNQAAAEELKLAEARLKAITDRLIALRPSLPPRLSEALELSYRTLADADAAAGERMQVATTVLNRCAQFNRLVTAGQDVLTLDGEPNPKSLDVIYWGLSHGYAIDHGARKAWLGSPGEGGWRWQPQPGAFEAVARLIAIATDRADPEFIPVPAVVTRSLTASANN